MTKSNFGTAIICIDGRIQLPVINWLKENFGLDYVDRVTEPGPEKIMATPDDKRIKTIKAKTKISVKAHNSKIIVVAGHYDCAGNPCSQQEHIKQIKKAVAMVKSWELKPVEKIIGVWVNKNWQVKKII